MCPSTNGDAPRRGRWPPRSRGRLMPSTPAPLSRALAMAQSIGMATGSAVAFEPALIEMDVGEMEHLSPAELRERYPDFLREWLSERAGEARMPGGETLR